MLEKTLESLLDCKEIQPVHPKGNQSWVFIGGTDVEAETPILWPSVEEVDSLEKTPILEKIEGRRRGDNRGWDGCMASPTKWTWVWVDSRSWWWTGRPGVLRFMVSQGVRHDWATELNWTCFIFAFISITLEGESQRILLWFMSESVLSIFFFFSPLGVL